MGCSDGVQACSATSTDQWGVTFDWLFFVPFYVLFSSSPLVLPWPTKRSLSSVPQAHLKYPQLSYSSCFLLLISYKFLSKAVPDNPWWSHQLMAEDFCPFQCLSPSPVHVACALCMFFFNKFLLHFIFLWEGKAPWVDNEAEAPTFHIPLEWCLLSCTGGSTLDVALECYKSWSRRQNLCFCHFPFVTVIKHVFNMALTALHSMGSTPACCLLGYLETCHHSWNRIHFWSNALGNDSDAVALNTTAKV